MKYSVLAASAAVLIASASAAFAKCDMYGNCYSVTEDGDGGYSVRGFNSGTGSTWNNKIESNGDQRGFDSNGNYWKYNNSTGNYTNFGTGQSCFGKGAFRTCN